MKREIQILFILILSVISSVAAEKSIDAAEPKPDQPVVAAFAVFKTGTLQEAKKCIARLDAALEKNPQNERLKSLKVSIKDVFLADLAITQANQNKVDAEKNINSKKRNLKIVSTPSTLSRRIDKQEIAKAKKDLAQANAELKKANKDIALMKKNLNDTIKKISEKMQPADRELLDPVFNKIVKSHEPSKPKKPATKGNANKKD